MFDPNTNKTGAWKPRNGINTHNSTSSSTSSTISMKSSDDLFSKLNRTQTDDSANSTPTDKSHIQLLCDSMKRQIISRAFYGWLAYCRHLRTVRTHLSDLVSSKMIRIDEPTDASGGLTEEIWYSMQTSDGKITNPNEIYRLIYFGGIQHSIRKIVWSFLLEHYEFDSTKAEREEKDKEVQQQYEMTMSEWLAVEAIVRQRDKEIMAANLAKLSSESTNGSEIPLTGPKDSNSMSNEVFDESDTDTDSKKSIKQNEINNQTKQNDSSKIISVAKRQLQRFKQVESQSSQNIIVTNPSIDTAKENEIIENKDKTEDNDNDKCNLKSSNENESHLNAGESQCVSPASSNGGIYSVSWNLYLYCKFSILNIF